MNKFTPILLGLVLAVFAAHASRCRMYFACHYFFMNPNNEWLANPITDVYGTNFIGFWTVQGCGNATAGIGLDNGSFTGFVITSGTKKIISGSWQTAGNDGCISTGLNADGSACAAGKRITFVLFTKQNEGATDHAGTIFIANKVYGLNAHFSTMNTFSPGATAITPPTVASYPSHAHAYPFHRCWNS